MKAQERWTDRSAPVNPTEDRAAHAWRMLRGEAELEPMALARLQHRLVEATRPRRLWGWRWQPALLAVAILGGAGMAAATIGVALERTRTVAPGPVGLPETPHKHQPRPVIEQTPVVPTPSVPAPAPATPPIAVRHRSAPLARPAPKPSDGAEVRLFSSAMRAWRVRDAGQALALLDDYQGRYPRGHFTHEALLVKIDALQAMGRAGEALAILRGLPLSQLPRAEELHLIRGELAAKAGQCQDAVADFDHVLRRDREDALGPRALYARASCRARLGDELGAETDLRLYLLRFPDGPHRAAVKHALDASAPPTPTIIR